MIKYCYLIRHQNKERLYESAIIDKGYRITEGLKKNMWMALIDFDIKGRVPKLEHMRNHFHVKRFFIYPHAARPNMVNDIYPSWCGTTAQFVATETHAEIMKIYGYDKPIHAVGWHLCDLKPFRPTKPINVLFAPIHPRMSAVDRNTNRRTFEILREMARKGMINLTMRFINSLELSGLPEEQYPYIKYVLGEQNGTFDMIDKADLVVSTQTFAYLAVARGIPTLMMNESMAPRDFDRKGNIFPAKHWDLYKHLMIYPLDILETPCPYELMIQACESDDVIRKWKINMIGTKMFDKKKFLDSIAKYY